MKMGIKKIGRKHFELYVDGRLVATGRSLDEIEQQARIMNMYVDLKERSGGLIGTL